jgi:hypothetical protein
MLTLPIATVLLFAITAANAGTLEMGAHTAECKEVTARLIEATNATFNHYSPSGNNAFFKKPDMVLSCMSHRVTGISLTWDEGGFPPNAWFGLLAKAGRAVSGPCRPSNCIFMSSRPKPAHSSGYYCP